MLRKITLTIGILLHFMSGYNQQPISMSGVDTSTYKAFQKKNWKQVICKGEAGLNEGIDFFYLRMRMGIAWFELKNYRKSIPHFQKAREMNNQERYVNEYLYYAYLYSGRKADAEIIRKKMPGHVKSELFNEKPTLVSSVQIHTAFSFNPESYRIQDFSRNQGQSTESVSQTITDKYNFIMPEVTFRLAPAFYLTMAAGRLNKQNHYYFSGTSSTAQLISQILNQQQFYIHTSLNIAKGVNAWGGYHHLKLSFPIIYEGDDYGLPSGLYTYTYNQSDDVASAGVTVEAGKLRLTPYFNFSTLNQRTQYISGLEFTWFPMGNMNFYTTTTASMLMEHFENNHEPNRYIINQQVGIKLFENLWAEGSVMAGEVLNYSTPGAGIVYNDINKSSAHYGIRLLAPYNDYRHRVYINFQTANYESYTQPLQNLVNQVNYSTYTLNVGAEWTF